MAKEDIYWKIMRLCHIISTWIRINGRRLLIAASVPVMIKYDFKLISGNVIREKKVGQFQPKLTNISIIKQKEQQVKKNQSTYHRSQQRESEKTNNNKNYLNKEKIKHSKWYNQWQVNVTILCHCAPHTHPIHHSENMRIE